MKKLPLLMRMKIGRNISRIADDPSEENLKDYHRYVDELLDRGISYVQLEKYNERVIELTR